MTVKELIEQLQQCDETLPVVTDIDSAYNACIHREVSFVEEASEVEMERRQTTLPRAVVLG